MKGPTKIERIRSRTKKSTSSIIGTLSHPNGMIVWNECLMGSETRIGRMKTGDAHRQGGKSINHFLQQLTIFHPIQFSFQSITSKKFKFLFSFYSFKSMKPEAMWSKMTKGTTMVTNDVFRSIRVLGKGSNNKGLFSF